MDVQSIARRGLTLQVAVRTDIVRLKVLCERRNAGVYCPCDGRACRGIGYKVHSTQCDSAQYEDFGCYGRCGQAPGTMPIRIVSRQWTVCYIAIEIQALRIPEVRVWNSRGLRGPVR